ncbi:MAG: cytochrome c peroxidase, partial [Thiohalorhabdaceae bacterium]
MRRLIPWLVGSALLLAAGGIQAQTLDPEDPPLGLPPVPVPEDNPVTEAKADLGERLFNEQRFSGDGTISCATCHEPDRAFTDGLAIAEGID